MRIHIIGKGNVACNLEAAFRRNHFIVEMVSSRDGLDTISQDSDVYIYAVRDTVLEKVVGKVHTLAHALHIHTSGTMPISVFGEDKPHAGIFYPFQSFSKTHIIPDFSKVPVFIEGKSTDDVSTIQTLASTITPLIYEASQSERERLHIAGVFANNFSNLMYGIAQDILKDTHIPFSALLPLIDETAQKVHSLSPKEAQTGPAHRHDKTVMDHHIAILKKQEYQEVYTLLSRLIQNED